MIDTRCYGCEGGATWQDSMWGTQVTLCLSCGKSIQPLIADKHTHLSPERYQLTDLRQSWSTDLVDYALSKGWSRGAKSTQSKAVSEICCPNSGCRKMNDADAKSCWYCEGRLK